MDNIKKFFTEKNINIFIIALYFCIVLITVFNHEIWRDEAQAWCLVRDLDFPMLYTAARYEGHPMLWYLLIYPLAKFGLPVFSMQIASFVLVFASCI